MDVGGTTAESTLQRSNNQIVISVGNMTTTVGAVDANGATAPLDQNGNISLHSGEKVAIKLGGFEPGTPVEMWMFSTPFKLASVTVGPTGGLNEVVTIPKNVPVGEHRIAIVALPKNGKKVTVTLGILVKDYAKSSRTMTWLIAVPIVLAIVIAMFLPPALRRRRKKVA